MADTLAKALRDAALTAIAGYPVFGEPLGILTDPPAWFTLNPRIGISTAKYPNG